MSTELRNLKKFSTSKDIPSPEGFELFPDEEPSHSDARYQTKTDPSMKAPSTKSGKSDLQNVHLASGFDALSRKDSGIKSGYHNYMGESEEISGGEMNDLVDLSNIQNISDLNQLTTMDQQRNNLLHHSEPPEEEDEEEEDAMSDMSSPALDDEEVKLQFEREHREEFELIREKMNFMDPEEIRKFAQLDQNLGGSELATFLTGGEPGHHSDEDDASHPISFQAPLIQNQAPKHAKKAPAEEGGKFGYPMKIQDIVVDTPPSSYADSQHKRAKDEEMEMTKSNEDSVQELTDESLHALTQKSAAISRKQKKRQQQLAQQKQQHTKITDALMEFNHQNSDPNLMSLERLESLVAEAKGKESSKNLDLDLKEEQIVDQITDNNYTEEDFNSSPHVVSSSNLSGSDEKKQYPEAALMQQIIDEQIASQNPPRQSPKAPEIKKSPKPSSPSPVKGELKADAGGKKKDPDRQAIDAGADGNDENDSFHRLYNKEIKVNQDEIPLLLMELTDIAFKFIKKDQFEKAYVLLQKTESVLEVVNLEHSKRDKYFAYITYHNLAMCFQKLGMLEECIIYLKETIAVIEKPQFFKDLTISQRMKQMQMQCQLKLQLCAILSQTQKHTEAMENAKLSVRLGHQILRDMYDLCVFYSNKIKFKDDFASLSLLLMDEMEEGGSTDGSGDKKKKKTELDEKLMHKQFIRENSPVRDIPYNILEESISMIERTALKLLPIMKELGNRLAGTNGKKGLQAFHAAPSVDNAKKLVAEKSTDLKSIEQKIQEKKETKDKGMLMEEEEDPLKDVQVPLPKKLGTQSEKADEVDMRTVLGFLNQNEWILNLNIGNIMQIQPVRMKDFMVTYRNEHQLSRESFLEKLQLLIVSYFCVSTEQRFIIQSRTGYMRSDVKKEKELEQEYWHVKALDISCAFLPSECPLFNHILLSYQKHHGPANASIDEEKESTDTLAVLRPLKGIEHSKYQPIIRELSNVYVDVAEIPMSPLSKCFDHRLLPKKIKTNSINIQTDPIQPPTPPQMRSQTISVQEDLDFGKQPVTAAEPSVEEELPKDIDSVFQPSNVYQDQPNEKYAEDLISQILDDPKINDRKEFLQKLITRVESQEPEKFAKGELFSIPYSQAQTEQKSHFNSCQTHTLNTSKPSHTLSANPTEIKDIYGNRQIVKGKNTQSGNLPQGKRARSRPQNCDELPSFDSQGQFNPVNSFYSSDPKDNPHVASQQVPVTKTDLTDPLQPKGKGSKHTQYPKKGKLISGGPSEDKPVRYPNSRKTTIDHTGFHSKNTATDSVSKHKSKQSEPIRGSSALGNKQVRKSTEKVKILQHNKQSATAVSRYHQNTVASTTKVNMQIKPSLKQGSSLHKDHESAGHISPDKFGKKKTSKAILQEQKDDVMSLNSSTNENQPDLHPVSSCSDKRLAEQRTTANTFKQRPASVMLLGSAGSASKKNSRQPKPMMGDHSLKAESASQFREEKRSRRKTKIPSNKRYGSDRSSNSPDNNTSMNQFPSQKNYHIESKAPNMFNNRGSDSSQQTSKQSMPLRSKQTLPERILAPQQRGKVTNEARKSQDHSLRKKSSQYQSQSLNRLVSDSQTGQIKKLKKGGGATPGLAPKGEKAPGKQIQAKLQKILQNTDINDERLRSSTELNREKRPRSTLGNKTQKSVQHLRSKIVQPPQQQVHSQPRITRYSAHSGLSRSKSRISRSKSSGKSAERQGSKGKKSISNERSQENFTIVNRSVIFEPNIHNNASFDELKRDQLRNSAPDKGRKNPKNPQPLRSRPKSSAGIQENQPPLLDQKAKAVKKPRQQQASGAGAQKKMSEIMVPAPKNQRFLQNTNSKELLKRQCLENYRELQIQSQMNNFLAMTQQTKKKPSSKVRNPPNLPRHNHNNSIGPVNITNQNSLLSEVAMMPGQFVQMVPQHAMQTQQNLRNQINKSIMSSGTTSGGGVPPTKKKSASRKQQMSKGPKPDPSKFKQSNMNILKSYNASQLINHLTQNVQNVQRNDLSLKMTQQPMSNMNNLQNLMQFQGGGASTTASTLGKYPSGKTSKSRKATAKRKSSISNFATNFVPQQMLPQHQFINQSPFPVDAQTIQDVNNLNIGAVDLMNQQEIEPIFHHEFMQQQQPGSLQASQMQHSQMAPSSMHPTSIQPGPLQQALVNHPQQQPPQMMMHHHPQTMMVPSDEMMQDQMGLTSLSNTDTANGNFIRHKVIMPKTTGSQAHLLTMSEANQMQQKQFNSLNQTGRTANSSLQGKKQKMAQMHHAQHFPVNQPQFFNQFSS